MCSSAGETRPPTSHAGRSLQWTVLIFGGHSIPHLRGGGQFCDPRLHDVQMTHDVFFVRRQTVGLLQAFFGPAQIAALHVHYAQVVMALNVDRVQVEDAHIAL